MANLQFKTYFKLNSISLCKNVLRAISAGTTDMPNLSVFPKSHIVTFRYYVGVIKFLEEDYAAVCPGSPNMLANVNGLFVGGREPSISLAYVPQIRNSQRGAHPRLPCPDSSTYQPTASFSRTLVTISTPISSLHTARLRYSERLPFGFRFCSHRGRT